MSTATISARGEPAVAHSAGHGLAVLLLAISAFVIVTTEFIIVGLLPEPIARSRHLDHGRQGNS